jgi:hypothetical protein
MENKKPKFNWNRFYDELETADPKKFPWWMWILHEGTGLFVHVANGIMLAVLGVAIMCIALPTVSRIMSHNDTIIQNFCSSYEKNQKIK